MAFTTGQHEVGEEPSELGAVSPGGVRVRNLGGSRIFVGGPDVTPEQGYPIDPGTAEDFTAPKQKESPVVPAPASDTAPAVLWAVTAKGTGTSKVALVGAG